MNSGIYLIKNMTNGKGYVGSTTDLEYRKYQHFNVLKNNKHHSPHLQYAFNKYGEKNFEFYVLAYCPENKLLEKEDFYIGYLKTLDRNNGYNINPAGRHIMSEEHKKKISASVSKAMMGVPKSEEHKKNISKTLTGRKLPPLTKEHKIKISNTLTGRKLPPLTKEHKRKISESLKNSPLSNLNKPMSKEQKRKISNALIGRKLPPLTKEHKRKISDALKGKKKNPNVRRTKR